MLFNKEPKPLQMQVELDQMGGELYATSAGQQLHFDLGESSEKESKKLDELLNEIRQANRDRVALMQEVQALRVKVQDLERQKDKLERSRVSLASYNP
jgi:predicted  nucleic acid-binding Zn-ribbon protein